MLQEIFLGEKLQWPKPYRCAVNFVLISGAEGLEPDAKGRIDAEGTQDANTARELGMEDFTPAG
jgi:hypothetical protein